MRSNKPQAKLFRKWVTSEVLPLIRKTGTYSTKKVKAEGKVSLTKAASAFKALESMARTAKLEKNAAVIAANQGVHKIFGIDCLDLIGATHLKNEKQELHLTVTELGKQLDLSAIAMNKLLEALGFQEKVDGHWQLTEKGKPYGVILDTGKAHKNGTPIQQIKWYQSVIDAISAETEDESVTEPKLIEAVDSVHDNGGAN